MSLVRAPQLGIERFANDRDKESWTIAASEDRDTIIRSEVGDFYWTVQAPDIVNSGREEQGSVRL